MIKFTKVRYKNFQSVGDRFIEIQLDKSHTTLISGANGSGKCVDKNTEIEISFKDKSIEELFKNFVANNI